MGAGASALGNQSAREIAKDMLNGIFANTSMLHLMELSNRSSCSKFAFDYKESLLKHLQTVQLYPVKGEKGKIALLSINDIAPGLITKATTPEMTRLIQQRDEFCIDAGYIYVRIFQIYFVLANSLMLDTPTISTSTQRGGAITKTSFGQTRINKAEASMLSPFLLIKEVSATGSAANPLVKFTLTGNRSFTFAADEVIKSGDSGAFNAKYIKEGSREGVVKSFSLQRGQEGSFLVIKFSIQDTSICSFSQSSDGTWTYSLQEGESNFIPLERGSVNTELIKKIVTVCDETGGSTGSTTFTSSSSTSTSGAISIATGSSMYIGFERTRKIFAEAHAGKAEYPRAYAIGRALTLMFPISPEDRGISGQIITQVCKKDLDFERNGSYLPKAGTKISDNIYYASLIGLYYDTYVIKGNTVEFKKTPGAEAALKQASVDLATLYGAKDNKETFIEKGSFKQHDDLCKVSSGNMAMNPQIAEIIKSKCIDPMLALQAKHSSKAESLIRRLFKIELTTLPGNKKGVSIDFSPGLVDINGRGELDKICLETRQLVLEYYMTTDSLFFQGISILEANKGALTPA
jgi:hypothetical protein